MSANPPTDGQTMPITPNHRQVIDQTLHIMYARVHELAPGLGYSTPPPLDLNQIRKGSLAKALQHIARYAEGYDLGPGSILPPIHHVACLLYPVPTSTSGYRLPPDFHKTPLGEMVNEALARHFPRERRMMVGEVRKLLGVTRQTVHDWAEDGLLRPIYEKGTLTFHRPEVESLQRIMGAKNWTG